MRIGIIIPFYKNEIQLQKCKKAIEQSVVKKDVFVETFIHNNSEENIGFTKAVNKGLLRFLDYDYCLVLNQDCYLNETAIQNMVDFMDKTPKCFIGGPKQISDTNEDIIIHGGCREAYPMGRHIFGSESNGDCAENKPMPWVNGACMIVRMKDLPIVGIMDEGFYLIGSDSDWCYTARQRGLEVWYIADAKVVHEQGVSARGSDKVLEYAKYIDTIYFRDKWINGELFKELALEVY